MLTFLPCALMQAKRLVTYSVILGILAVGACSDIAGPRLIAPPFPRFDGDVSADSIHCQAFGGCREPTEDEWLEAWGAILSLKPEGECGTLGSNLGSKLDGGQYKIIPVGNGNPWAFATLHDGWVYIREDHATMNTGLRLNFPHEGAHEMGYGLYAQSLVDYMNTYRGGGYTFQEDQRASDFAVSCWQ